MAQAKLEQTAYNSCCRYERRSLTATFGTATSPGSLLVLIVVLGGGSANIAVPANFVLIRSVTVGRLTEAMYYYQNAPSANSVTVTIDADRSMQVRCKEYSGAAQSNAFDQVTVQTSVTNRCHSGFTGTTSQPGEIVVAAVANSYTSCSQFGFLGGLIRLFESISPSYFGGFFRTYNDDSDRTRMTIHHLIVTLSGAFYLACNLTSSREWIAIVATFRDATSGPRQLTSKNQTNSCLSTGSQKANLYVFGPLRSTSTTPVLSDSSGGAIIYPFEYQYWVGDNAFLVGKNSPIRVQKTSNLYGFDVRQSDTDLPRNDGALRGVDLEAVRIATFTVYIGKGKYDTENHIQQLMRAMIPQRDDDWQLTWRHPSLEARIMYVRPTSMPRTRDKSALQYQNTTFALRAADPRHYSAALKRILIPVSLATAPQYTQVTNDGDLPAYPVITISNPSTSTVTVTRATLTNSTNQVIFDVAINIPPRSTFVGDMYARVTSQGRSPITLDGVSVYGAWKLPRDPFRIEADPSGLSGYNLVSLTTEPAGAPILCQLSYRDTWAG